MTTGSSVLTGARSEPAGAAGGLVHRRLTGVLAGVTALLVFLDLGLKFVHLRVTEIPAAVRLFNVALEGNVPTWWNSGLLLLVAGSAGLVGLLSTSGRRGWLGVALVAALMSLDESVSIHERLGVPAWALLNALEVPFPTYGWVLPGSVLGAVLLWSAFRWSRGLPSRVRRRFALAVSLYFLGALGVEAVNGWTRRQDWSELHLLGTALEESLEMGSCILATAAFLGMLRLRPGVDGPVLVRVAGVA